MGTGVLGPVATVEVDTLRLAREGEMVIVFVVMASARSRYRAVMTVEATMPARSSPSIECVAVFTFACWSIMSISDGRMLCKNIGSKDHPPPDPPIPHSPIPVTCVIGVVRM